MKALTCHFPATVANALPPKHVHLEQADQLENPEWEFFIELDAVQAYKSRIKALSGAARRRDLVLSYHESFPGLGHVSVNGAAFSWTPAETEFMGTAVKTQC